ncbi:hypothetical protein DSOL_1576 [Desulfosporosinus metallidurans]|uniref:Uncharacterized protein n=1 Tax=Desulfosporosinus metallidurans TaxID=1888891 RepID=A0A1Q8QYT7_9FIRM|nr:hypothetical protein DSOL_1576 [Desulfosporosinus metallidurans]
MIHRQSIHAFVHLAEESKFAHDLCLSKIHAKRKKTLKAFTF